MCYTLEDSRNSYILNFICSIILIYLAQSKKEYLVIGYFLLFVGQMQLFDYLFWKYPPPSYINTLSTKLGIVFNNIQPIILLLLLHYYNVQLSSLSIVITLIYVLYGGIYTLDALLRINHTNTRNNIMYWEWQHLKGNRITYALFILSFVCLSLNFNNMSLRILSIVSILFTLYIGNKQNIMDISTGRMWCYFASFVPLIFILHLFYYNE